MEKHLNALYEYAWNYFSLHAGQRLTAFNFYIVISSLLVTGLFATLQKDFSSPGLGIVLGFFLIVFSIVFERLDSRTRQLIHNAEAALKYFEKKISEDLFENNEDSPLLIFLNEERETNRINSHLKRFSFKYIYSYSVCFRVVFCSFAIIGLIGIIISIFHLIN